MKLLQSCGSRRSFRVLCPLFQAEAIIIAHLTERGDYFFSADLFLCLHLLVRKKVELLQSCQLVLSQLHLFSFLDRGQISISHSLAQTAGDFFSKLATCKFYVFLFLNLLKSLGGPYSIQKSTLSISQVFDKNVIVQNPFDFFQSGKIISIDPLLF